MIGNSGMPLPSVRGLGEHSHRMSEGERMRSAGRGLGYSKMTDDNQIILPLGRGRGDPKSLILGSPRPLPRGKIIWLSSVIFEYPNPLPADLILSPSLILWLCS